MSSGRTRWDIVGLQVGKVPLPLLETELGLPRVIAGLITSSFNRVGAVFAWSAGYRSTARGPGGRSSRALRH